MLTSIPGSSCWFERGFVTYSNESKQELLGVSLDTLNNFGAVSYETITEMTHGALNHSHAKIAISISGISGPSSDTWGHPVGTIWLGLACPGYSSSIYKHFHGDRASIRQQVIDFALFSLVDFIKKIALVKN